MVYQMNDDDDFKAFELLKRYFNERNSLFYQTLQNICLYKDFIYLFLSNLAVFYHWFQRTRIGLVDTGIKWMLFILKITSDSVLNYRCLIKSTLILEMRTTTILFQSFHHRHHLVNIHLHKIIVWHIL